MGDTLFHLLPEIFLGEDSPEHVRFVMVDSKKNLVLGAAILVGFMTFVAMDKGLRIATGGEGHDHSHGTPLLIDDSTAIATGSDGPEKHKAQQRKKKAENGVVRHIEHAKQVESASSSIRLGAYLNLIADFTHNITDGLAMSASFYTSPTIGATTTMAVFFHEIPHEVGDFALLIQSGFSKRAAMGAQFVTAIGALLGTVIGIVIQEFGGSSTNPVSNVGLFGTSLQWGDMLLPFTAGTFLYVGTVAVIPELLEVQKGASKSTEVKKTICQFAAVAGGAGIMLAIS